MLQPKQRNCRILASLGSFRMESAVIISALCPGVQHVAKKGGFIPKGCSASPQFPTGINLCLNLSIRASAMANNLCQLFVLRQPRCPKASIRNFKRRTASQKGRIWGLTEILTAGERRRMVPCSPTSAGNQVMFIFRLFLTFSFFFLNRGWG